MDIINFINTVGFPIFVAVYFLIRLDNTLKEISTNLLSLNKILENYKNSNANKKH